MPPPSGSPAIAFLKLMPRDRRKRVAQRIAALGIIPEADAAGAGPEMGRVDADHGAKAGLAVRDEVDDLMIVEVGIIPRGMHVSVPEMAGRDGAIDGT